MTAAAAGVLLAAPAVATATRATMNGTISPDHGPPGTPVAVTIGFTLDPEAGQSSTVTRMVMQLPQGGRINGRLMPSCAPHTINARRGVGGARRAR